VQQGELVCLIGANGAGKSTTLKALAGIQSVASGPASIMTGTPITGMRGALRVRKGFALECPDKGTRISFAADC